MFLALAVAALVGVQTEEGQPEQWLCGYSAVGSRGSSLDVQFYVEANGTVVGQGVLWSPPVVRRVIGERGLAEIGLTVAFDHADKSGLGAPANIGASVLDKTNLDVLDDATAMLVVAGAASPKVSFDVSGEMESGHYRSSTLANSNDVTTADILIRLGSGRRGTLVVLGADRNILAAIDYDFSGRKERDRLFRKAWRIAKAKIARLTQCDKTSADAGVLTFPVPDVPIP